MKEEEEEEEEEKTLFSSFGCTVSFKRSSSQNSLTF
jgi:hypothetical protein